MAKVDLLELEGTVIDVQRERFLIETPNGKVLGYLGGKQKLNKIRVVLGDKVRVEVSPYDISKGRITYRYQS